MPPASARRYKALIDAWTASHGYICPGDERHRPHRANPRTNPLTVDHIKPRSLGGTEEPSNLRVLCRKANSAKRDGKPRTELRRGRPPKQGPPIERGPEFPHPLKI